MVTHPRNISERRGSVYIAVTGTALLVSLIGFTSLHLSRLKLREATAQNERTYARQLAHSGVELALARIKSDSSWRSTYDHGVENFGNPTEAEENIYFRLLDNDNGNRDGGDGNLDDDSTEAVEIQGIGRYGASTFVYSVVYSAGHPVIARAYDTDDSSGGVKLVNRNSKTGQYFVPQLPAEAISWSVTSVDVKMGKTGAINSTLYVKLYSSDANNYPDTLYESVSIDEGLLPASPDWYPVNFSTVTGLSPTAGLCLTLEGEHALLSACTAPYNDDLSLSDSHRLLSKILSGVWNQKKPDESLLYRIHGVYTTASGDFAIEPGSWKSVQAD